MIPMVFGTIKNAVKLAEMDSKWQQKKENAGKIYQQNQMSAEERQIAFFQEDMEKMRENNKHSGIYAKVQSGQKLTPEEEEYLRKKSPETYADYKNAEAEKEGFKKKLRNCKSKDEVRNLKIQTMSGYLSQAKTISTNPNIPKSKKIELLGRIIGRVTGINEVFLEYVKSPEYQNLKESELIEDEKKNKKPVKDTEKEEILGGSVEDDMFSCEELKQIEQIYTTVTTMQPEYKEINNEQ